MIMWDYSKAWSLRTSDYDLDLMNSAMPQWLMMILNSIKDVKSPISQSLFVQK